MSRPARKIGRPVVARVIIDDASCGPAMLALNPAQRAWVWCKVTLGVSNAEATRLSGYSTTNENVTHVNAHRIAHMPAVQAAILELGSALMRSEGPKSILTLVEIRDNKRLDAKDRLKAAESLLSRSGFTVATQTNISVEHHLTDSQMDARILELARELGIVESEARKMLIAPDRVIEGDFTEVEPVGPPTEERAAQDHRNALHRIARKRTREEKDAVKERDRIAKKERRRLAEETRKLNAKAPQETGGEIQW